MEILSKFFGKIKASFNREKTKVQYRIVFQEDFDEVTGEYTPDYYLEKRHKHPKLHLWQQWEVVKSGFRSEQETREWFDKYLIYLDLKREQSERKKQRLIDL